MKTLTIIIFLFSATVLANTESDKNKFTNNLSQRYIGILCGNEILSCLNKGKKECASSVRSAVSNCSVDNFFNVTKNLLEDEELQKKKIEKEAFSYGNCVTEEFFK